MTTKTKKQGTQHTPGPWLREGRTIYALEEDRDRRGRRFLQNRFTVMVLAGPSISPEELEANTLAVQAAPQMLDALREADAALDLAECRCSGDFECSPCKATTAVHDAIELATQSPGVAK